MNDAGRDSAFGLDRRRLRQALQRAADGYDRAAFLHLEVGQRLLERLDLIKLRPEMIVDVGCGAGQITRMLMRKYRKARVIGLELAPALVKRARARAPWLRTLHGAVAEPEALPLPPASCDLIFSNLALPWTLELDRVFAEFQRVLRPGGALFFSTLGPDTLGELRRGWAMVDDRNHVNAFFDMHDVGDALLRARLAEPVMDVERLTLTYSSVDQLARDLRALGAANVTAGRRRGLTGKGRWQALRAAYEGWRRDDGLLPVTCEVIYGHAWGASPQPSPARDGVTRIPVNQVRRRPGSGS